MKIHVRSTPMRSWLRGLSLLAAALLAGPVSGQHHDAPNYDVRENPLSPAAVAPPEQTAAVDTLRKKGVKVTLHPKLGVPSHVTSAKGFLSSPDAEIEAANKAGGAANVDLHRPIKGFLRENKAAFGHGDEALAKALKKREFVTAHNGMRTVTWEQEFQDIPVFGGILTGHITKKGELVSISSLFVPDADRAAQSGHANWRALLQQSPVSPEQAVSLAAQSIGENVNTAQVESKGAGNGNGNNDPRSRAQKKQRLKAPGLQNEVEAKLVWFPINGSNMRLAWCVGLISTATKEGYQILVDADTGEVLLRQSLTSHASPASYRIFPGDSPTPMSPGHASPSGVQPSTASRVLTTLTSIDATASPLGWINDGDTTTKGNNVDARVNWTNTTLQMYGTNTVGRPVSATRVFDYSWSAASSPTNQWEAAVSQLFYWANWMHDKLYQLGFTEAAGNFQWDNFGRGGVGNDAVVADVQTVALLSGYVQDNAFFYTPPDEANYPYDPWLASYMFWGPDPDRDSAFDQEMMLHEYTHGLSNRRVGGGVGLRASQSRGMGEGWSDFYALAMLSESADDVNGNYAFSAYASYHFLTPDLFGTGLGYTNNYYYGIRRYPYTTALSRNPLTFRDIDPYKASLHEGVPINPMFDPFTGVFFNDPAEVHNQGEVWCVTLWDARANLINKYGYTDGNQLILQLVTDGMNLCPPDPTFIEARDAIIQADRINNDGRNAEELWRAFAKRGMGFSAEAPESMITLGVKEAFDLPDEFVLSRRLLAATRYSTAAVKPDGTVWTWGNNQMGELGDGFLVGFRATPGIVSNLTDVVAVAGGGYHFLALKRDGTLMAWGFGSYGQIGDGATTTRYSPVAVPGISNVVGISAGDNHSLALKSDGTVWAWGHNAYGQLGDTTSSTRTTPTRVTNLTAVAEIASGYWHNLALKADGTVWAWGGNFYGAIGDGTTTDRFAPVHVTTLNSVMTVEGNNAQSFAVRNDGSVWAWGLNGSCVLGDGTSTDRHTPVRLTNISDVVSIDGGHAHTVALKTDGTVWTWGWNGYGSLGDGTTTDRCAPGLVTNLTGVVGIAAGSYHTIALRWDGTNFGWGYNTSGQLGDGSYTSRTSPVAVQIGEVAAQEVFMAERLKVGAGYEYSVALGTDGTVWTWGKNDWYQLGDGTNYNRVVPRAVNGIEGVVSVVGGYGRTLALRGDGTVWAWGYNATGEIGDGTTTYRATPVQVVGLSDVVAIAGNARHSLALKSDGKVWAWGQNLSGALGDGTSVNRYTPVQVSGLSNVVAISAGGYHSLAVRNDGTVWAWGANSLGQIGDGTTTTRYTPVQVSGLSMATSVSAGYYHSMALKADGSVVAWGYNLYGQLGDGTTTDRLTPVAVSSLANIANIDAGLFHSAARSKGGVGWAWGNNLYGQLGDGTTTHRSSPIQINGINEVTYVSAGYYHTIVLQADGSLWASGKNGFGTLGDTTMKQRVSFVEVGRRAIPSGGGYHSYVLKRDGRILGTGLNSSGELGDTTTNSRWNPTIEVTNLGNVIAVASGENHGLAVKDDGTVWAWGLGTSGQLGDGTTNNRTAPVQVSGLYGIVHVAAGYSHSLALRYDGVVFGWGANAYGQLGDGSTTMRLTPVQVSGLTGVLDITAGSSHSAAVKSDGNVWAWGGNWGGQCGDGTTVNRTTPVQCTGVTNTVEISAGYNHTMALSRTGALKAWGENGMGQIGDGTMTTRLTAVFVTGISNVIAVASGGYHTMAIKNDGVVWTWGANWYNQLGDGSTTQRNSPVVMSNMTSAIAIDAGSSHSLIIRADGHVWSAGFNNHGQLGVGNYPGPSYLFAKIMNGVHTMGGGVLHGTAVRTDTTPWSWGSAILGDGSGFPSAFAWQATNLNNITSISGGSGSTLAVRNDGTGWAWGENWPGKLGAGLDPSVGALVPVPILLSNVVAVSGGGNYNLFLKNDGSIWSAGYNGEGELGVGFANFFTTNYPVQVSNTLGFAAISAALYHCVALHSNGTVWAWGNNWYGELGDGDTNFHRNFVPVQVVGLSNIIAIDSVGWHGLALRSDGRVMAWGYNADGRLGDGTTNTTATPVMCVGLSNIVSITAGGWFSQAVDTNGNVFSWGSNYYGGLGDGTTVDKHVPTLLTTIKDVKRVKAGFYDGFALKKDHTLMGWGVTDFGELGDGTVIQKNSPVLVGIGMYLNAQTPKFKL